jgi:hypothetical protein
MEGVSEFEAAIESVFQLVPVNFLVIDYKPYFPRYLQAEPLRHLDVYAQSNRPMSSLETHLVVYMVGEMTNKAQIRFSESTSSSGHQPGLS